MSEKQITLIQCGGHVCDSDGPQVLIRNDAGRVVGASRTCSQCNGAAIDADMMESE